MFKSRGNFKKLEPSFQLAVALHRFGSETSSGNTCINTGQIFGIGEGTVILYTQRIIMALMSLWNDAVRWPLPEERTLMQARLRRDPGEHGWGIFQKCIGVLDGTLLPFKIQPAEPTVSIDFFSRRKQRYGLQATVVCDDQLQILLFTCNHPGSVHDARAWRNLDVYQHPDQYFRHGEYLLADSAYELNNWCVTPYKKPRLNELVQIQRAFNARLSALQVVVEHVIGVLKARFSSLRSLPQRDIWTEDCMNWALAWVGSCVVLHNLLLNHDDWEPSQEELEGIIRENDEGGDNDDGGG